MILARHRPRRRWISFAIQVCREATLSHRERPEFAHLILWGKAQATQKGYEVDGILLGEIDADGGERQVAVSCHIDEKGELVNVQREQKVLISPMPVAPVAGE